ncbi:MIP family channel protein [Methanomethylovorans hollandica DSM 15978]|uniref:MIP family channel protein n=1 Tax=Methanomethylovorans hollandica (strain DSM 15978 / NBRC 107637 / DMS1) TaxID=867904 RepID=L0KX07_METHD|nr:MIP/aquaporin family protein [Methanomethylovorans hollandica]AGB49225.1 MIP family channel protein [Methanomethylovorans hollandica DSM 15978]
MAEISLFKRSIAELIGTYVLVFLGTGSVVTTVLLFQGWTPYPDNNFNVGIDIAAWLTIGMAFAIAIIAMIYAFGHISGTHINPAVSIALWATKRFPASDMVSYIVAQLIGASLASFTIVAILGQRAVGTGLGATAMFSGVNYGQAILCETIATFFLMLTIMGTAVDKRAPAGFAGLAIGLVVAADIIVVGNITGSSLNPARTFGPYLAEFLLGGSNLWWQFPIYIIGPIAGALLAAFLYDYVAQTKQG